MFILLYLITSFLNIFVFYIWPITLILFISQYYYTFLIYYFNKIFFHPPQRCHSRENGNPGEKIWIPRIKCGASSASAGMTKEVTEHTCRPAGIADNVISLCAKRFALCEVLLWAGPFSLSVGFWSRNSKNGGSFGGD